MMRTAVIDQNNVVVNVIEAEEGFSLPGYLLVQSDEAQIGWVYGQGAFSPPARPLDALKAEKIAALAERRWQAETAGFLWQRPETEEVYYIATDPTSQAKIDAERKAAEAEARRPGDVWKCGDPATGMPAYVVLTDAEIIDMSTAARTHVSDCFNHEAYLAALILAAEDEAALDAIDINSGWPG